MLKLENIDVRYGPIHAVKDVSLTVGDAQIVAILGSNGAGKSSLLRAIAGAEKTSGGINLKKFGKNYGTCDERCQITIL